jgi:nitroreductase/Pyruvate/2-oxoacid:ferredoxin oxidoreductase delta subunit
MMGKTDPAPSPTVAITIENERCTRCGRCLITCPRTLLVRDGERIHPVEDLSNCLICGHCVAVCEPDAIRHSHVPLDAAPALGDLELNDQVLERFLRRRRSIRRFRRDPVEPAKIERLLDIARYAPTGGNVQGVHYTVLTGDEVRRLEVATAGFYRQLIRRLENPFGRLLVRAVVGPDGLERLVKGVPDLKRDVGRVDRNEKGYCHNAPVVFIVHGGRIYPTIPDDCCFATYHLILAAETLALGSCLIGFITQAAARSQAVREVVGLPKGHRIYSTLAVGYPAERFFRLVPRNPPNMQRRN